MRDGSTGALTHDAFLGGRIRAWQPRLGYRAGVDPVFLAAAVAAQPGQHVLELGAGVGVASLCLGARVQGLVAAAVELQPDYAALARRNAVEAGQEIEVHCADIAALPAELKARAFDHVFANPPYHARKASLPAAEPGREAGRGEGATPLALWVDVAARRLRPGGWLTLVQRAERLPEILGACGMAGLGGAQVRPLAPRKGRAARLVLLRARKGGRAPFCLLAPLVLHEGAAHLHDGPDYSATAEAILRDGAAMGWLTG